MDICMRQIGSVLKGNARTNFAKGAYRKESIANCQRNLMDSKRISLFPLKK